MFIYDDKNGSHEYFWEKLFHFNIITYFIIYKITYRIINIYNIYYGLNIQIMYMEKNYMRYAMYNLYQLYI